MDFVFEWADGILRLRSERLLQCTSSSLQGRTGADRGATTPLEFSQVVGRRIEVQETPGVLKERWCEDLGCTVPTVPTTSTKIPPAFDLRPFPAFVLSQPFPASRSDGAPDVIDSSKERRGSSALAKHRGCRM